MMVFLRFLCISLKAHGIWHYGPLPSKFDCLPNAIGLQNRVTLTFAALAASWKGSLVEPVGAEWLPKPPKRTPKPTHGAPKSPKGAQMSPTGRPAQKIHEKSSPKHGPEQRRTMKYDGFPLVFVYFAEIPWHMALWPLALEIWLFA